ncbi:MAG: ABC transporter permease [Dehalococcoidia bacterium]|nr:ABC transporter permease [Dehalococcoidia bacterium]
MTTSVSTASIDTPAPPRPTPPFWRRVAAEARRRPVYAAAATGLVAMALVAVVGPFVGLPDPAAQSLVDRLQPPLSVGDRGTLHLAGTDQLGRDVFSRAVHGARTSLTLAVVVILISSVLGTALGLIAGYRGGMVDTLLMRVVDLQMAFPPLLLAIFFLYVAGASLVNLAILLTVFNWIGFARVARAQMLSLKNELFVESAIAVGASDRRVIVLHILPHMAPVLLVLGIFDFASLLLAEAGLSFLGLGVQPPESSWGLMLSQGQAFVTSGAWWLIAVPGFAMFSVTLAANLTSRWLQEIFKLQRAS